MRFSFVDVFAPTPLSGNPVTVVPDADDLSVAVMQAVAREFNQSETTFLLRPSREGADWRLRSFTPIGAEVFGAGHNALGAWLWLEARGHLAPDREEFVQEIGDDLLPVTVSRVDGRVVVTMHHSAPRFGRRLGDHTELADGLGLGVTDLLVDPGAEVGSTGADHLLVPVADRETVDRATPDTARLRAVLADVGAEGCYVYALDPHDPSHAAYARFFNPTVGIPEDPATGTAAGPLVARLVRDGVAREGEPVVVEQGWAMGRPSLLTVSVRGVDVRLRGSGLVVGDGTLLVPS